MDVTIYTQTGCGPCKLFKIWLKRNDIDYQEKNITENEVYLKEFLDLQPKGVPYTIIKEGGLEKSFLGARSELKKVLRREKHLSR
ncbi:glutaredoxin family protein [Virgibacillus natechei]